VDSGAYSTEDLLKVLLMMMWSLRVMWPSIVEEMDNLLVNIMLHLVNDIMVNLCSVRLVLVCHGTRDLIFWPLIPQRSIIIGNIQFTG